MLHLLSYLTEPGFVLGSGFFRHTRETVVGRGALVCGRDEWLRQTLLGGVWGAGGAAGGGPGGGGGWGGCPGGSGTPGGAKCANCAFKARKSLPPP